MSLGRLSERLTIQSLVETADSQGGASTTPTTLDQVWAELVPQSAGERIQAQAMGSTVLYRFRIRARTDVSPTMQVSWTPRWPPSATAQTLQIHGVTWQPDRTYMILDCGVRD